MLSPIRADLAENLRSIGPCSVAQIAAVLGRPADTLYRHIATLQKAGFIRPAGYRKSGRHIEQLIDAAADDFQIDLGRAGNTAADNDAVEETFRGFLKAAAKVVSASAAARRFRLAPGERNVVLSYEQSRLTPEAFAKVRGLITQIKKLMDESKGQPEGELYLTVGLAAPVAQPLRSKTKPAPRPTRHGSRITRGKSSATITRASRTRSSS